MATLNLKYTPPNYNSDASSWLSWYGQLESSFGKKDAFTAFSKRWNVLNAGGSKANTNDFRTTMKAKGINIEANGIAGSLLDSATGITDSIGGFLKVGGTIVTVMYVAMIIFALAIVWRLAKPEAIGTVVKYAK